MKLNNNSNPVYYYKSQVGTFYIRYNSSLRRWDLGIGNVILGNYHTANAAADDVYNHSTGCYEWDRLDGKLDDVDSNLSYYSFSPNT